LETVEVVVVEEKAAVSSAPWWLTRRLFLVVSAVSFGLFALGVKTGFAPRFGGFMGLVALVSFGAFCWVVVDETKGLSFTRKMVIVGGIGYFFVLPFDELMWERTNPEIAASNNNYLIMLPLYRGIFDFICGPMPAPPKKVEPKPEAPRSFNLLLDYKSENKQKGK